MKAVLTLFILFMFIYKNCLHSSLYLSNNNISAANFCMQVKVRLSRNETRPDHKLSMVVSAKPGSCLCFVAVDRSVQLLQPDYQITLENVSTVIST